MQPESPHLRGVAATRASLFPSSNLVHRRNGSADRRSATLSAGKRSASAPYQGWQLTVARWLDFSDNLLFVPPARNHSRNLTPYMTSQRDVSWGELKSLPTCCTYVRYVLTQACCVCVHQLCVASLHTPQLCGQVVQYDLSALNCFWMVSAFIRKVMRSKSAHRHR